MTAAAGLSSSGKRQDEAPGIAAPDRLVNGFTGRKGDPTGRKFVIDA